jgi:hypothetical protein
VIDRKPHAINFGRDWNGPFEDLFLGPESPGPLDDIDAFL